VTDLAQVYRPTPKENRPKREIDAARDIEEATGLKPGMIAVRPNRPPRLSKPNNGVEGR